MKEGKTKYIYSSDAVIAMKKDENNNGRKKGSGAGKSEERKSDKRGGSEGRSFGKSKFGGEKKEGWQDKSPRFGKGRYDSPSKGEKEEKWYAKFEKGAGKKKEWEEKEAKFGRKGDKPERGRGREQRGDDRFSRSNEKGAERKSWENKKPRFTRDDDPPKREVAKPTPEGHESSAREQSNRKGSFEEKRIKRFFKGDESVQKDSLAKPDFSKFNSGTQGEKRSKSIGTNKGSSETGDFKSVYKGRDKDEKPVYLRIPKSEIDEPPTKGGRKSYAAEVPEERPNYDLEKLENKKKGQRDDDEFRLNKYISNSGICSRREADELIKKGQVTVNGETITEMGFKVRRSDQITFLGKTIRPEKPVYILLNKPKDFITTTDDPMERKTVMHLIENACQERVFPVGRLDRNTTGLLLFTNDGELADKLSHPSNEIKKIYQVTLDKPLTQKHEQEILEGITLEDGPVPVKDMQVLSKDRTIIGLEIHLGRNRIVRRIFAHFDYDVVALDRVMYATLDKKDLPRGKYRFLSEKEVIRLKYLGR